MILEYIGRPPDVNLDATLQSGCGAPFQTSDLEKPGYLSQRALEKATQRDSAPKKAKKQAGIPDDIPEGAISLAQAKKLLKAAEPPKPLVCLRCHKLKHEGVKVARTTNPQPAKLFADLRVKNSGVVVIVADVCDMPASIDTEILQHIGTGKKLILAANKIDIFPQHITHKRIMAWLERISKEVLRGVKWHDIKLLSAQTGDGIFELVQCIIKARQKPDDDVFLVGCANVGKSALINALRGAGGETTALVTTSALPGTTIGSVRFDLNSLPIFTQVASEFSPAPPPPSKTTKSFFSTASTNSNELLSKTLKGRLVDTPGLRTPTQLTNLLSTSELKQVIPRTPIEPQTLYLHPSQSCLIGGLAHLSVSSEPCRVTFYMSKHIPLHPCRTNNVESLWQKHWGNVHSGFCYPPMGVERAKMFPEVEKALEVTVLGGKDNLVE
ncbi:hypothetical protein HK097_005719, partial [Rhizophlyctis rosea]